MKLNSKIIVFSFFALLLFGCFKETNPNQDILENTDSRLELIGQYKLSVPEPSGLELSGDRKFLWTVSDENNSVYKISKEGEIIDNITIDNNDLEGIALYKDNGLCIIGERDRSITFLDSMKKKSDRITLQLQGKPNSGIEGIAFNSNNNHLFVVNEKKPKLLIELDDNLNEIKRTELNYAKDYSALYYDSVSGGLWILSDESQTLFLCDSTGTVRDKYEIAIPQMEGVAVDGVNNLIYIVSDKTAYLYVFKLKDE